MEQYIVTGMSCAACQARVEKAVSNVEGVTSCSVSLLTNSMGVEGNAPASAIIRAVEDAGYGASLKGQKEKQVSASEKLAAEEEALKDRETPKLKKRLLYSVVFLLALMYLTMGHHMLGLPLPAFFHQNFIALGITQLLLSIIVMLINEKFFTGGFRSLLHGAPNMDTLVALGSSVSFAWSLFVLYRLTGMTVRGETMERIMDVYHNEMYFESAAMIPTLITIGKMLEARSKGKTTDALKGLMRLAPKKANVVRDGVETEVDIDEVVSGDVFVVRPGESIPVDGIILEGSSAVNEAALTGESIPADKGPGDTVSAATVNQSGFIKVQATRVGEDTTLSQIIKMVSDAAATKAPIARKADIIAGYFVPFVIAVAVITTAGWLLAGATLAEALERGIAVLVISCPCALGLATPVAIMVGTGLGAKNGVLFKTSESLETAGEIQIIALDKTGTITSGEPKVTDLFPAEGVSEEELLAKAYAVERMSEHPLAGAVSLEAENRKLTMYEASDFRALPGSGLEGMLEGRLIRGGSRKHISALIHVPEDILETSGRLADEGKTPLFFAEDSRLLGVIAVADVIKPESPQAVSEMRGMGIEVVMLTGDNEKTARAIGRQAGVDRVIAGVLPDGKEEVIRNLQKRGKTAMVGDGINDAPALTRADIGIAIGAGTDVAIDAADIVLMKSRLTDVPAAIRLSRQTVRNIHENLFWAFFYNVICIPLAAGLFAYRMNPMVGAAAMSLSSVTVVSNALRLNLFDMHSSGRDKPLTKKALPEPAAEEPAAAALTEAEPETFAVKTLLIEGMMCEHCEASVKKGLEAVEGVISAEADHVKGTAVIKVTGDVSEEVLKKAVEDRDYTFIGIKEEETEMKKVLTVEGMMCEHCEASVKKALEAVDGVESASADRTKNEAVAVLSKEVADEVLKAAVEAKDYKVTDVK